jgi:hypothetical protein
LNMLRGSWVSISIRSWLKRFKREPMSSLDMKGKGA